MEKILFADHLDNATTSYVKHTQPKAAVILGTTPEEGGL
jgi:hypothetical protein